MQVLEEGFAIPFITLPGAYEEDNNASARNNPEVVRQQIEEMISKGIVRRVATKPKCISPLGLVTKQLDNGQLKHRLIFDASRWVNNFIIDQHVKLTGLLECLELTEKGDCQIIFDLVSAYYHIKIAEQHRCFLGAKFSFGNEIVYFEYCHLPFGLKCAVHVITKIWKPVLAYLHRHGVRSSIYIDDGRILTTPDKALQVHQYAFEVIQKAGWCIEEAKSTPVGQASHVAKYLGFIIDTKELTVMAEEKKIQELEDMLDPAKCSWDVKTLAQMLGKTVSLIPSHGWLARICTRTGYKLLEQHVDSFGWKGSLIVDECFQNEQLFLKENLWYFNGRDFPTQLAKIRVDGLLENPQCSREYTARNHGVYEIIRSDASQFKAAVKWLQNDKEMSVAFTLNTWERLQSSGYRELLCIQKALLHWKHENLVKKHMIYWCTDSQNVLSFLAKGSSKQHIQKLVFEICQLAHAMQLQIEPVHLFRDDIRIQDCDDLSKYKDSDDWSVDEASFQWFKHAFPLELDGFANSCNTRLDKFYSEFYEQGTSGVNIFAQKWNAFMWLCPPIACLPKLAFELRSRPCNCILTFPVWTTAGYFNLFFDSDITKPKEPFSVVRIYQPYVYQNQGAKSALFGKVQFDFVALLCNTL